MSTQYVPADPAEAAELEVWADRFEKGWSADEVRAMPRRGRPLAVGDERAQSVTIRLLPRQLRELDELAARRNQSRSEIVRSAVERELAKA